MSSQSRNPSNTFLVWDGIYDEFPAEDPHGVFAGSHWIEKCEEGAQNAFEQYHKSNPSDQISNATLSHEYPLQLITAFAASELKRQIRVLDFGGGLAASFPAVAMSLPSAELVDFSVVEVPELVERGRARFAEIPNLHFCDVLPTPPERFDVIHAGSALQYVRDWEGLLRHFTKLQPRWLAFGNLLAGANRTFITRQNYYGQQIPVRFLNLNEFTSAVEGLGYRLIYKSLMIRTIFGRYQPLPTDHFPPECRLRHGCNLVFIRDRS